jgi:hypothetical protein
VTTGPGDETASAGGHGRLRASHADREQVVGTLKAAYVQGRLTKDELDDRVGRTLAARTYADLAALTADLPPGLSDIRPRRPARAPVRPPMSKVVAGALLIIPPPAAVLAAFLTGSEVLAKLSFFVLAIYFLAWIVAGAQICANWHDKRSRAQLRPPSPQGRAALEGKRDRGTGDDLVLCEARSDIRPGRRPGDGVGLRAWRSAARWAVTSLA